MSKGRSQNEVGTSSNSRSATKRRLGRPFGVVTLTVVAAVTSYSSLAFGQGSPTWGSAIEVPGTAGLNAGGSAAIHSISCSSAGNCSAGGSYLDGSGKSQAFVVGETNGTWGEAIEVPGTGSLNARGNATIHSISCSSSGNCGAGGSYVDSSGNSQAFVVSETTGTWGNAVEVIAPLFYGGETGYIGVPSISCSATGSCVAVGEVSGELYFPGGTTGISGNSVGFVVSETNGTWGNAIEIPFSPFPTQFGAGGTGLSAISCNSPGNCSADGDGWFPNSIFGDAFDAFVVDETNGTWGSAVEIPGLASLNLGHNASVYGMSCNSPGNCSAGGNYVDSSGSFQAFIANETNGTWNNAVEVPGSASFDVGGGAILLSISCSSVGNCGAGGTYWDASNINQDFVVSETNGTWGSAIEVPGSSSLFEGGTSDYNFSISCSSAGNCGAGGSYTDGLGKLQGFVVNETNGTWGSAIEEPGPASLNVGGSARINSISCSGAGSCSAGGGYSDGSKAEQAFIVSMVLAQAALSVTSTSGTVGTALTLTTSGGSGTGAVSFSVTNGTASGCTIAGTSLSATSAGTCLATATKAADTTYSPISSTVTDVSMALPARPGKVTLVFAAKSTVLTPGAKRTLVALSRKLLVGASVTITGFAQGDAKLAKSRASAAVRYLNSNVAVHVTIKTVTSTTANKVTVTTTRQ